MDLLLLKENSFNSYGLQHYIPLILIFIIGLGIIIYAKNHLNPRRQKSLLFWISTIPFIGTFMLYPMAIIEGPLDIKEDLPLHLCRFLALATPFVVWKENRYWIGIFYFWIMVGTLNANITPELTFGFPHWSYFCYWMTHGVLIIIPLYYIFIYKLRIDIRDFRNAFIMLNVFLIITFLVNSILGSNYMYTMAKPSVDSMLNMLGPWPNYLISGQLLVVAFFYLAFLPFQINKKLKG